MVSLMEQFQLRAAGGKLGIEEYTTFRANQRSSSDPFHAGDHLAHIIQ